MRKSQLELLQKADARGFSKDQINTLSKENLTIDELNTIYNYFFGQYKFGFDNEQLTAEVKTVLSLYDGFKQENKCVQLSKKLLQYLLPQDTKDTLIDSDKKAHILKVYIRVLGVSKNKGMSAKDFLPLYEIAIKNYVFMLYQQVPIETIDQMINPVIENCHSQWEMRWDLISLTKKYPCLLDDCMHNSNKSLLFFLCQNAMINKFAPTNQMLERLYNYDKHEFLFAINEFGQYFYQSDWDDAYVENPDSIAELSLPQYPLLTVVSEFCNKHAFTNEYMQKVFSNWYIHKLINEADEDKFREAIKILTSGFSYKTEAYALWVDINTNYFVNITYMTCSSVSVHPGLKEFWMPEKISKSTTIMITPDGKMFQRIGKQNKHIPLTWTSFMDFIRMKNLFGDLMRCCLNYYQSINPFFNDMLDDYMSAEHIMPLTFNEVYDSHNRSQLLRKKYKLTNEININWNKRNVNLSYMIIKSYNKIDPTKGRQVLLQQNNADLVKSLLGDFNDDKIKVATVAFITNIICEKIKQHQSYRNANKITEIKNQYQKEIESELSTIILEDEQEMWLEERVSEEMMGNHLRNLVRDYVNMCVKTKKKIRLDIKSVAQITNLHDDISKNRYRENTKVVVIPKKSVFLPLRKILPNEFEWIKSRKRLILETELQHHCVWSYAESISADRCAIYSFVDKTGRFSEDQKPRRFTIEFNRNKDGSYSLRQVQGKFNQSNTEMIENYIQSLLEHNTVR